MTEREESGGPTVLTSSQQAQALLESVNREILGALLKQPSSASEIALEVERPLKTVLYRLEKLLEVGLVCLIEPRKRGGRAVKVYAACSSTGWSFPFTLTPAATVRELLEGQMMPAMSEMLGHLSARIREEMWLMFTRDEQGRFSLNIGAKNPERSSETRRQITGTITTLRLNPEQARALNQKLRDLVLEVSQFPENDSSHPTYYLGLFFVPKAQD